MIFSGQVTSGIGVAKMWVSKIQNAFEVKTNIKVFHGTLNIKLDKGYIIEPDFVIKPEEYGGTQNVLVKKCKIKNNTAYIVRAEKNQIGQGDHDLNIIEIVSDVKFREKYNLQDGEILDVEIG